MFILIYLQYKILLIDLTLDLKYLGDDEPSDDSDPEGEESMDNDDVQLDHSLGYDCTRR